MKRGKFDGREPIRYTLIGDNKPISWQLPLKGLMAVDEKGHKRNIVYIPGANTIFAHKYKGDEKPKRIYFENTILDVDPADKNLVAIIKMHPWLDVHFKLFSETVEAMAKLSQNALKRKALALIDIANEDNLRAVGMAVLEKFNLKIPLAVLKAELEDMAFDNPKDLIAEMTNPNFKTRQLAGLAIMRGTLSVSPGGTAIMWPNGKILVSVPPGQDPIKRLGEYLAENTKEAMITLQEIESLTVEKYRPQTPGLEELVEQRKSELDQELKAANEIEVKEEELVQEKKDDAFQDQPTPNFEEMSQEELNSNYQAKYGKNIPANKKNNLAWIINKLMEPVEA